MIDGQLTIHSKSIHEFVPPAIYEQFADKSIWFIDPKIVQMAQFIRDRFGFHLLRHADSASLKIFLARLKNLVDSSTVGLPSGSNPISPGYLESM
jgi:hypothetical protein